MKISAKYLAKKLFISFAKEQMTNGKTAEEAAALFTLEVLNKLSKEFCEKNGFELTHDVVA